MSETDWQHTLRRSWQRRGALAWLLWPLSLCVAVLVWLRRCLYRWGLWRVQHLPVPVIVVGNVLAGGVGKTPIVIALVEHCQRVGRRVGVVSRGHGRRSTDLRRVLSDSDARDVGDEPLLIAQRTNATVWVGADRVRAAQALLEADPDVDLIISDDGLQHLALARDLELCVFDERGVGNGWLLPAGPLREPWPRAVSPGVRTLLLLSIDANAPQVPETPWASSDHSDHPVHRIERRLATHARRRDGTTQALDAWRGQPVQALAGIAKPERFFAALRQHGLTLQSAHALPDHAVLDPIRLDPSAGDCLCTEKDAVKLWPRYPEVWAVPLHAELPVRLCDDVDAWLQGHSGHGPN